MIARKDEQISALVNQVETLTKTVTARVEPETKPAPPEKPEFTAQDWEDDPEGCSDALYDYREAVKEYNATIEKEEAEATSKQAETELKALHTKDFADEVAETPALNYPQIRQLLSNFFFNPETGFSKRPDGVLRATRELKRQAKEQGIDLSTFGAGADVKPAKQEPSEKKETISPEDAARKGAQDEAARNKRVQQGTMHAGGKSGGEKAVSLNAQQKEVARRFGVSEEVYAKTIKALGGKK